MAKTIPGPPGRWAPCRLTIDYEARRLQRQWSPRDFLHRRVIAVQRQCELLALLGMDIRLAREAVRYWKQAEWAGIRRLQRAEASGQPEPSPQRFLQARRGGVLPRNLIIRRDPDAQIRARMAPPP